MFEQLISFETSKLVKEKGIIIDSEYFYTELNGLCNIVSEGELLNVFNDDLTLKEYYYDCNGEFWLDEDGEVMQIEKFQAPTQSLLQKLLRDEYNLDVQVLTFYNFENCVSVINGEKGVIKQREYIFDIFQNPEVIGDAMFDTYEIALEKGLFEALKLIK